MSLRDKKALQIYFLFFIQGDGRLVKRKVDMNDMMVMNPSPFKSVRGYEGVKSETVTFFFLQYKSLLKISKNSLTSLFNLNLFQILKIINIKIIQNNYK